VLPDREIAGPIAELGLLAFTTTRRAGSFGTSDDTPVREITARWSALRSALSPVAARLATASQVHGARVVTHGDGWAGWLRVDDADGHATMVRGSALAVTIADCVPVFLAHPGGAVGLLHAGWRGTAAGILSEGIRVLSHLGAPPAELIVHLGPAICGACYEVSPDVHEQLTGRRTDAPARVDLRGILSEEAVSRGVRRISISESCTRCGEGRFFSHRGGDSGRQLAVIALPTTA
jgi:polyphenol oxidase